MLYFVPSFCKICFGFFYIKSPPIYKGGGGISYYMSFLYVVYLVTSSILSNSIIGLITISLLFFMCFLVLWSVKSTLIVWLRRIRNRWLPFLKRLLVCYTRSGITGLRKFKLIIILRNLYYILFRRFRRRKGPFYFLFILPYKLKFHAWAYYRVRPKYRRNYKYCFGIILFLLVSFAITFIIF